MNKTPISILQEIMVQRKASLPDYVIEDCCGVSPNFKCTVKLDKVTASAFATTKKEAKQKSAEKALQMMGLLTPTKQIVPASPSVVNLKLSKPTGFVNYVGILNEFASTHGMSYPVYDDNLIPVNGLFSTTCKFLNLCFEGQALKKKDAKQEAARAMLESVRTGNGTELSTRVNNLKLDDRQSNNISNFDQEICKKYEEISSTELKNSSENKNKFLPMSNLQQDITLEDLKEELQKRGFDYTIEQFQSKPCIMMMKINNSHAVFMGRGESKEAALKDLIETAVNMFRLGFSLNVEL